MKITDSVLGFVGLVLRHLVPLSYTYILYLLIDEGKYAYAAAYAFLMLYLHIKECSE